MHRKTSLFPLWLVAALSLLLPAYGQFESESAPAAQFSAEAPGAVRDQNVVAQLVANQSTITPGGKFTIGLKFTIDPTWHTYWINPGETGTPTELDLKLPEGFRATKLLFPTPKRFVVDYSIPGTPIFEAGFGYEDSVIHPMIIQAPDDLEPGSTITLDGTANWLMCDPSSCVPGMAELSLTLKVGGESVASPEAAEIEKFQKKVPEFKVWAFSAELAGDKINAVIQLPEEFETNGIEWKFFPLKPRIFDQLADVDFTLEDNTLSFSVLKHQDLTELPDPLAGILIAQSGDTKTGYEVTTDWTDFMKDEGTAKPGLELTESTPAVSSEPPALPFGGGLIGILFAAFLGGMILNVMPCVFPVISLKVMSFVGQAGEDRKKVLAHSIVFALGILIFFWILTVMMLILRNAGGGEVGWGAQLQEPIFIVILIYVMVAVALSLFGLVEFGTSMTAVGGDLANKSGYAGSFWSGALAVLLATPCTAPLMAPAIGFALSQSAPIMFAVFTALGLGLAAPYFVFAAFPKLLDVIPAPGPWMETFKQFMGFPMLAVAVWLIGVLSKQLSVEGLQWSLAAVLFLALAIWILGRFGGFDRMPAARNKARVAALLVFLCSGFIAWKASGNRAPSSNVNLRELIADHREEGKHVFVDFTAEWCVTCKVNERTTIKTEKVQTLFKENNVEFVIADWTNKDAIITEILAEHGRAGVPFYLLYPADTSKEAISLGDGIITAGDIEEAIEKL
ncbi:MAG: thioredoxin family protein [Verrucomicrobiales bacterium]|nr:thioredoxin family protein [Verrucomicrobiales bacterium]